MAVKKTPLPSKKTAVTSKKKAVASSAAKKKAAPKKGKADKPASASKKTSSAMKPASAANKTAKPDKKAVAAKKSVPAGSKAAKKKPAAKKTAPAAPKPKAPAAKTAQKKPAAAKKAAAKKTAAPRPAAPKKKAAAPKKPAKATKAASVPAKKPIAPAAKKAVASRKSEVRPESRQRIPVAGLPKKPVSVAELLETAIHEFAAPKTKVVRKRTGPSAKKPTAGRFAEIPVSFRVSVSETQGRPLAIFLPDEELLESEHQLPDIYHDLFDEYGENTLLLMTVDPETLFACWEMVPQEIADLEGLMILRLYDVTGVVFDGLNAHRFVDYLLTERVGTDFFHVEMAGREAVAELGVLEKGRPFRPVIRSRKVVFPSLLRADELGIAIRLSESGIPFGY